jgi:hypothetical protein
MFESPVLQSPLPPLSCPPCVLLEKANNFRPQSYADQGRSIYRYTDLGSWSVRHVSLLSALPLGSQVKAKGFNMLGKAGATFFRLEGTCKLSSHFIDPALIAAPLNLSLSPPVPPGEGQGLRCAAGGGRGARPLQWGPHEQHAAVGLAALGAPGQRAPPGEPLQRAQVRPAPAQQPAGH